MVERQNLIWARAGQSLYTHDVVERQNLIWARAGQSLYNYINSGRPAPRSDSVSRPRRVYINSGRPAPRSDSVSRPRRVYDIQKPVILSSGLGRPDPRPVCNTKNMNMICAGSEVLAIDDPYIQCVDVYNTNYNEVLMMLWSLRIKSCAADGQPHNQCELKCSLSSYCIIQLA